MSKKYLNLHVLYTFAGANPNRDDVGAPKTLVYGGKERSRMSAQAMTRAKRVGYESDPAGEESFRSKSHSSSVINQVISILENDNVKTTPEVRKAVTEMVMLKIEILTGKDAEAKARKAGEAAFRNAEQAEEESGSAADDTVDSKDTVSILSDREVKTLVNEVVRAIKNGKESIELEFVEAKTSSMSIAAFGRMFANRPKLQCEAAIQRGSAFTTHESFIEMDYFTVFDDLNTTDQGAAHLGIKQLTGGVYYWHASIDREQLLGNLMDDFDLNEQRAKAFFSHLLNDLPSGMVTTTATSQLVPFVLIVDASAPISLQSAFEKAITSSENGYLAPSVSALLDEHEKTETFAPDLFGSASVGGVNVDLAGDKLPTLNLEELSALFAAWVKDHG